MSKLPRIFQQNGRINCLINNSGVAWGEEFDKFPYHAWYQSDFCLIIWTILISRYSLLILYQAEIETFVSFCPSGWNRVLNLLPYAWKPVWENVTSIGYLTQQFAPLLFQYFNFKRSFIHQGYSYSFTPQLVYPPCFATILLNQRRRRKFLGSFDKKLVYPPCYATICYKGGGKRERIPLIRANVSFLARKLIFAMKYWFRKRRHGNTAKVF